MIQAIILVLAAIGAWAYWRQYKAREVPLDRLLRWFILRKYGK